MLSKTICQTCNIKPVMVGDMNSAKLYILRGSTLSGTAAVITSDDLSTTNLWYKRL